jgi:hypothetical protein
MQAFGGCDDATWTEAPTEWRWALVVEIDDWLQLDDAMADIASAPADAELGNEVLDGSKPRRRGWRAKAGSARVWGDQRRSLTRLSTIPLVDLLPTPASQSRIGGLLTIDGLK